ncbi:MAG TPA: hypothetical protein VEA40_14730 [Ramlibacter sp.]|nr:hypothetical protein [Ramlibacter sp.]
MPDPKDNAKLTGDTHLPDVESDLPLQEGSDDGVRGQARPRSEEGRPGRGVRKAGVVGDGTREEDDGPVADAGGDGD